MAYLVLFTDFGARDLYVGQVKAVFARDAPGVPVVDLLHDAPAFNARASAHLLASLVGEFPQGSVFFAVVDPGVGSRRAPVAVWADGYRLVGPDNGLLSVFTARARHAQAYRIVWKPPRLSASFHGRDLFAPVAAKIASGAPLDRWLVPLPRLAVDFGAADLAEIVYVDHFGNAMTGLRAGRIPRGARLKANGHCLVRARTFSSLPPGRPFWYENSQGLVEIAANQASAADLLDLRIGSAVEWIR